MVYRTYLWWNWGWFIIVSTCFNHINGIEWGINGMLVECLMDNYWEAVRGPSSKVTFLAVLTWAWSQSPACSASKSGWARSGVQRVLPRLGFSAGQDTSPLGCFKVPTPTAHPFIPMEAFATPSISYTKPYLLMSPPPVQVGEHSFARAKGADGEALHRPRSKVASRGWAVRQGRVEAESSLRRWLPESHTSEVTVTNKGTSLPTSRHFCDMALEKKYGTPMMRGPTVRIH